MGIHLNICFDNNMSFHPITSGHQIEQNIKTYKISMELLEKNIVIHTVVVSNDNTKVDDHRRTKIDNHQRLYFLARWAAKFCNNYVYWNMK